MMKVRSGHIIFDKKVSYRTLAKHFPELIKLFLEKSKQLEEEKEFLELIIKTNMADLIRNRKPEGYNKNAKMRLMFPIVDKRPIVMYIYRPVKSEDVVDVTNEISKFLKKKRIKHKVEWDKMLMFERKRRG